MSIGFETSEIRNSWHFSCLQTVSCNENSLSSGVNVPVTFMLIRELES